LIKAVLFDFDGVLVNSMSYHVKAWQAIFSDFGASVSAKEILLLEGARTIEVAEVLRNKYAPQLHNDSLAVLVQEKQKTYRQIADVRVDDCILPLIAKLNEHGLKIGIVTGSPLRNVEHTLSSDLLPLFHAIVTADDVEIGKPNPDCYLKAAAKLKMEPEHCLVVENAPLGITAACNAGMKVVALTSTLPAQYLGAAAKIFSNLNDFLNNIELTLSPQTIPG